MNPAFTEKWFLRCQDLVDKYQPDLLYFDNIGELPLDQAGLDIVAHYYNANRSWHDGREEGVVNVKGVEGRARAGRGGRHRARRGERHPADALADRHLHRRVALSARHPLQVGRRRWCGCWSTS